MSDAPALVPPADAPDGGTAARTVSAETGSGSGGPTVGGSAERRVSEFASVESPENKRPPGGVGHGENGEAVPENGGVDDDEGLLPRPSPAAAHGAVAGVGQGAAAAGGAGSGSGGNNCLVSETEDNGLETENPSAAAAAASTGTGTGNGGNNQEGTPTAIPQEDDAAAEDEEAAKQDDDDDDDEDGEESDYSYEYEDEEDHYGGFIVEADHPIPHAVSATASTDGDHAASGSAAAAAAAAASGAGADGAAASAADASASASASASADAAANNGGSGSIFAPVALAPPRKSKWRDPSREAVNMSLRAEKETTGGKRRLASDLYKIMMRDTEEAGFEIEPKSDDSMDIWTIRLFGFDTDSNLHKDMMILGLDSIELEMSFPDQYPFAPPFVRVVRPRFKRQTGFVMNGALCMELLTADGWNPVNDIESVIVSIRSLLVVGDGRLEAAVRLSPDQRKKMLAEAEARLEKKKSGSGGDDDASDDGSRKRPRDGGTSDDSPDDSKKKAKGNADDNDKASSAMSKIAPGSYTTTEAKSAYQHLSDFHKKKGWDQSGWWAKRG